MLTLHRKATKPRKEEFRERVRTIIERTLTGNSKDECVQRQSLRQSESKRGTSSSRARCRGCAYTKPGNGADERVAVRHGDASDGYIIENQHEEEKNERHPSWQERIRRASEEQSDEWRKTDRLEHEALNTFTSSNPCVASGISCEL